MKVRNLKSRNVEKVLDVCNDMGVSVTHNTFPHLGGRVNHLADSLSSDLFTTDDHLDIAQGDMSGMHSIVFHNATNKIINIIFDKALRGK